MINFCASRDSAKFSGIKNPVVKNNLHPVLIDHQADQAKDGSKILWQVLRVKGGETINYCYVLVNKDNGCAVLVDPALDATKIYQSLNARKSKPTAIILTHHHADHTDLADSLAAEFGIDVYMSKTEIETYQFECTNLRPITTNLLCLGGIEISVLPTPGHTAGSVCFQVGNNLFTGDTLFLEGCGFCVGPGSSVEKMYDSLQFLKEKVPDNTRIFPGHRFQRAPGLKMKQLKDINVYLQPLSKHEFATLRTRNRSSFTKYL